MDSAGVEVLLLCGQANVSYATGARVPSADHMRASWWRSVAVLERDSEWPHLYTEFEGAPVEMPATYVHPAIEVETGDGATELAALMPSPRPRARRRTVRPVGTGAAARPSASVVLGPAKLVKSPTSSSASARRRAERAECRGALGRRFRRTRATSPASSCAPSPSSATANTVDPSSR
jgi:hypothetical protein